MSYNDEEFDKNDEQDFDGSNPLDEDFLSDDLVEDALADEELEDEEGFGDSEEEGF
jgi:hypothetical protein